ncbi:MAG: hypothetical protein O7D91_04960 [Planctomycetota bacterium]|nr:hypothetical protein [Planctomycetota bacterium]
MDAAQPYTRPIIGIGMVNDKGKGDFVLLQKTFRGFLLGRDRAVIDDVFANTQQHNELSKHDVSTFAKKIGLPGYVQSDVLRFRLHEGSARIHNPNVMRRFSYNYWPVEKGHPPSMEDYGPDC